MIFFQPNYLLLILCLLYSTTNCFHYISLVEKFATLKISDQCSLFRCYSATNFPPKNDVIDNSAESCFSESVTEILPPEVGLIPKPFHSKVLIKSAIAIQLLTIARASSSVAAAVSSSTINAPAQSPSSSTPIITHKVFLDIKIANYTEESIGKNRGALGSGRVVFGLYGKDAPQSVEVFLRSIDSDGKTVPSYINTQFARVSEAGVLEIEKIRGLNTVNIAGNDEYEYAGEVLDYKPILESNGIKHSKLGLLTRTQLTAGPIFGITLRKSEELDAFHVVFGTVLEGEEVLQAVANIPTYTYSTATGIFS